MSFWAAAQIETRRESTAVHFLGLAGFTTYGPRVRERRRVNGRQVTATPLLFPSYLFVLIEAQWHSVRWCPGIVRVVLSGDAPSRVPDRGDCRAPRAASAAVLSSCRRRRASITAIG